MEKRIVAISFLVVVGCLTIAPKYPKDPTRIGLFIGGPPAGYGMFFRQEPTNFVKDPLRMELREVRTASSTNIYNVGALIQWNISRTQMGSATLPQRERIAHKLPLTNRPLPDWDAIQGTCKGIVSTNTLSILGDDGKRILLTNYPGSRFVTNGQSLSFCAMRRGMLDGSTLYDYGIPVPPTALAAKQ